MPLNVVGIIDIVIGGMVTCDTILTSISGGGSVEIGLHAIGIVQGPI